MLNKIAIAIATTAVSLWPIASQAATLTETTDVGELLSNPGLTDSQPAGTSLDSISGSIGSTGDVDLYQILVSGGPFSATTTEAGSPPVLNTQLFLFNATGLGVFASDDASGDPFFKSTISGSLTSGTYYVGVSNGGSFTASDPQSAGGAIFNVPSTGQTGPNGPGAASPLSSWSTPVFPETGNYTITFTGAEFVGSTDAGADYEFSPTVAVVIIGVGAAINHFRNKNK